MDAALSRPGKTIRFRHGGALLHAIMEHSAIGMALVATDGRITYANPAFGALVGYEPHEWVGRHIIDLVHPDDIAEARVAFDAFLSGEVEEYQAERRYVRKDGSAVWVLACPSVMRDERTRRPLYMIVQLNDIDRRKRAEAALATAESRWNIALECAGQGVWDHDLRTGEAFYSRMWRQMRGMAPDEEIDPAVEAWLARVHPEDRERIREQVRQQNAGGLPAETLEYREMHRDGRWLWILSRGRPIEWHADGRPSRVLGTDTDITPFKAAEAELASEKELLHVTLEAIADGVISTDADGRVVFMNPAAEHMTGWCSTSAVGRPARDVFTIVEDATGAPVADPVQECLARRQLFYLSQDVVLVSRTGERRDIRDSAAPVRTPDGRIIGSVLVFQDITHSRALQKELAHSAMHDSLTGLPNRSAFERALEDARAQTASEMREHALCFIDIDRFKLVNDSAGHAAGDALLKEIATVIRKGCGKADFAARIGGDEFAVMLADTSLAGAKAAAERIVAALHALHFCWQGSVHMIGASVGITAITCRARRSADLMSEADIACYAAKANGRNSVSVYDATRLGRHTRRA